MKVKFFGIRPNSKEEGLPRDEFHIETLRELESSINRWLAQNPGIRIEHIL
jgi:hypothetical protein